MSLPNAIALIRVSSEAQAGSDREGLPVQREACERIALAHGLTIVEWVELDGVSGAAVLADPRFADLLARLQSPNVEAVIVAAFDRLFRRGRFADYAILDAFAETETPLYSADGELDLTAETGGLLGVLRGELAGMERRAIARRTTAGRRRKRREKGVRAEGPVGMPRGVRFNYDAECWEYVWPEAEKVRECFRLFLGGVRNFREIHRRTGIGKVSDASASIGRLLRQPLYAGIYRVDRTWEDKKPHPLPESEVQEHAVLDPPLVSRADFDEVQRILASRRAMRPQRRDPEQLDATYTGHVGCASCNRPVLVQRDSRKYLSYACTRRSAHDRCGWSVSTRLADPRLDAQLGLLLGDADTLAMVLEASVTEQARTASLSGHEIARRLTDLGNRRERLIDLYTQGDIERRDFEKRSVTISDERTALELMIGRGEQIELPDALIEALVEVFGSWATLARHQKRELLAAYRVEIVVTKRGPARGSWLRVDRVRLNVLPPDVWLYKKMKRLGIE